MAARRTMAGWNSDRRGGDRRRRGARGERLVQPAAAEALDGLVELVEATAAGDRIYFTDWRGDSDERLTEYGPTVAELLRDAAVRDVEVRALMWRSHPGRLNG